MVLKNRYKYCPQMKEYDKLSKVWLPYLMYFNQPNYSSSIINTDSRGFRCVTNKSNQMIYDFNNPEKKEKCLFVGNSTALGIGSSNDENTIPSIMNRNSEYLWYNFSGRLYSSTQELLLFLLYGPLLKNIKKVIIFSGVNNLSIYYLSKNYIKELGSFIHSSNYNNKMNSGEISTNRKILKFFLQPLYGNKIDYSNIRRDDLFKSLFNNKNTKNKNETNSLYSNIQNTHKTKEDLLFVLKRDIEHWKNMSNIFQFELIYALQPYSNWIDKTLSPEEKELFSEIDQAPGELWNVLNNKINTDKHQWISSNLSIICENLDIKFIDINKEILNYSFNNKWLFIDRIHITDEANSIMAKIFEDNKLL